MEAFGNFTGALQLPAIYSVAAVQGLVDLIDDADKIDDGMAFEHLGQTVGAAAGQAFPGPFVQMKREAEAMAFFSLEHQSNIKGSLLWVPQERFEKVIGPIFGKNFPEMVGGEKFLIKDRWHRGGLFDR
jgi:hypothetical protein